MLNGKLVRTIRDIYRYTDSANPKLVVKAGTKFIWNDSSIVQNIDGKFITVEDDNVQLVNRTFQVKFRRYTDYNCTVEAISHAKAKMQVAHSLVDCKYFSTAWDVLKEINSCRVLKS